MDMYNGLNPNAGTFTPVNDASYKERVSYDPNGNILGYLRNGDAGKTMDSLNYKYYANTNQLSQVRDNVLATKYTTDIDSQAANNYTYDAIGNMISDAGDTITNVTWNVYGKIMSITKNGRFIKYVYDAGGNHIMKYTNTDTTVYVRDAGGNVMSVYTKPASGSIAQTEMHLYGSSRLGMAIQHLAPDTTLVLVGGFTSGIKSIFTRGEKLFELSNHLGNVLATVTDRRIQVDGNSDGTVDSYKADIISANDYYPGGMLMPGRKYSVANTNYRYGFNGNEKSNEIELGGNSYTAEFWQFDARLGRRWNRDPRPIIGFSPYATSLNNPIVFNDPLGDTTINGQKYEGTGFSSATTLEPVVIKTKSSNIAQGSVPTISLPGSAVSGGGLWENAKDITGRLLDATVESVKDVSVGVASAVNAFVTDNIGGAGRQKSNTYSDHPISQKVGERVGDGLALIWGGVETVGGGGLAILGGGSIIIPGVGEFSAPVVGGGGLAIATHGIMVTVPTAWNNLMKVEQTNEEAHQTPSQNSESPIAKSSDIEKVNDKYLKDKGIDAHALKDEWLGKGKNSDYDIYKEKSSGELIIYKKGGRGVGIRTGEIIK